MSNGYTIHKNHILKAITWRLIGTIDTMAIAWFLSGNPLLGLKIGFSELFTKIFLYYLHEHFWHLTKYVPDSPRLRALFKTITWRIIGTLDTVFISYFFSNNALLSVKIGCVEVMTKMVLYYGHERVWNHLTNNQ